MDIRKIKNIELVEESGIAELEITEGEESVRINRNNMSAGPNALCTSTFCGTSARQQHLLQWLKHQRQTAPAAPTGHQVKSPMVVLSTQQHHQKQRRT